MSLEDQVGEIQQKLGEYSGDGAKAYDDIVESVKNIEPGTGLTNAHTDLIGAMANLWLAGVRYNAVTAVAPGRIAAELAQLTPDAPEEP